MAEHLTVLKADGDKVSAQEIENALEKLRGLSALLEDHEGELALRLHSAAGNNPKLLELLPDSPALRKMPVLQHLTKIIPVLSLELTNGLQQLAAQENILVTEEQEQLAQQQEEAARLADLQAEEDAQEELHYQDLEEKLRKNAADREKQEQDRRSGTGCRGDPDSVQRAEKAGVRRRNRDQKPLTSVKTTPGRASALPGKENDQPKRTRSRPQWGTQLAD